MRYKTPVGEIDLVMRRGRTLAVVEVKAPAKHEDTAHAIHHPHQARVMRAAQHFSVTHPHYANFQVRFDAGLIAWYSWPKHLSHPFMAS
jgi:putative endonuclease